MALLVDSVILQMLIVLLTCIVLCALYVQHCYGYWRRRYVPFLQPKFPLGNNTSLMPKGIAVGTISRTFYNEFKKMGHKIGGVYIGMQPKLVITEVDYIKDIFTKDFEYFMDRGIYQSEKIPITVNMFSQPAKEWKNSRIKFTSMFSSAKLKMMFEMMVDCTKGMKEALEEFSKDGSDVDMLEMASCFTTDVIGSCAFGVTCNSFKNPNADFRRMGRKFFGEFNILDNIKLFLTIYFPDMAKKIGVGNVQKDVSEFFYRSMKDTVDYRESNSVHRKDLLEILIALKNSDVKLSMDELTAQAFLFFVAGFETSSSTITLGLYELARHQEIQDKVRMEVLKVLKKHGSLSYEALAEMGYLAQVVNETLRIWPPVPTIPRVCTKDYTFNNSDITVEKGTTVLIPALGLHHDPEHWPDPLKFDPDRFAEKLRDGKTFTYIPFGQGPRNCIGMNFGLLQSKIGLMAILKHFRVTLSPRTITPLGLDPDTFVLHTLNTVYLNLEKIE